MLEFAFALPVVLAMGLGGLEAANLALAHLRVSQIAMTVADNAGRVSGVIDESNLYEVFVGARLVGEPLDFEENGRVVLSALVHNGESGGDEGQEILWQRCFGDMNVASLYGVEGDGEDDDSLEDGLGPDGREIQSLPGTAVMFVEVTYDYQPIVADNILGPMRIRYESAFNVRDRTNQDITNARTLPVNSCKIS